MKNIALYMRVIFILFVVTLVGIVCVTEYSKQYGNHDTQDVVIHVTTEDDSEPVIIATEAVDTEELLLQEDKNVPVEGSVYTGTLDKGHEIYNNVGHDFMNNVRYVANVTKPAVALTFDDGPGGEVTDRILDILEHYNARATFFVVGSRIKYYPDNLKRAYDMGCVIGSHTYWHKNLTKLSEKQIKSELSKTNKKIKEIIGVKAKYVRPPYGSINGAALENLKAPAILWSVDTRDWESRNTKSIVGIALKEVEDGAIILMHDVYETTADAVEQIVPKLIEQGYQLVTIEELAAIKGTTLKKGERYSEIK